MKIQNYLTLLCFIQSTLQSTLALAASNPNAGSTTSTQKNNSIAKNQEEWNASVKLLEKARDARVKSGHETAAPYYKEFLQKYPRLMTADARIAAASSSLKRQDAACPLPNICNDSDETFCNIQKLRFILEKLGFNNENIQKLFGINSSTFGPVYLKPVATALNEKSFNLPPLYGQRVLQDGTDLDNSSLRCLVAMFILGYAIPRSILEKNLIGGKDTIKLMESLGLAFPCEIDKEIIVPYVHIFPLSIPLLRRNEEIGKISENEITSMLLVTDLHPTLLCRTTVGCADDGGKLTINNQLCKALSTFSHLTHDFISRHVYRSG